MGEEKLNAAATASPDWPALLAEVRDCRLCAAQLPAGPRPVVHLSPRARLLIIGQAPGTRVHATGIPWNDRSGDRLRHWMGIERAVFYDSHRIAIMPMGFCYPGRDPRGGDLPPRPECAPTWHKRLRAHLTRISLTLLVGHYAQKYYLGPACGPNMTETVRAWRTHLAAGYLPLPHPSWRNTGWLKRNPWFLSDVLPELRNTVAALCETDLECDPVRRMSLTGSSPATNNKLERGP